MSQSQLATKVRPNELMLVAYKKKKIEDRIGLLMNILWDEPDNTDELIERVTVVSLGLQSMKVPQILPIRLCENLITSIQKFTSDGEETEISSEWFIGEILSITRWISDEERNVFVKGYLNPRKVRGTKRKRQQKKKYIIPLLGELTLTTQYKPGKVLDIFLPLKYAFAAVVGMYVFHKQHSND